MKIPESQSLTVALIYQARIESISSNYDRLPDNVMVHPAHKKEFLLKVIEAHPKQFIITNKSKIFGMRLIWTDAIDEDEVVCTFDNFNKW